MKKLFFIFCFFFLAISFGAKEEGKAPTSKSYSEKEFMDAVEKEVLNRLNRYKPKNIVNLSKEYMKKERALDLREAELSKREETLRASEKDLASKLRELNKKGSKLIGCLDDNDKNETKRINHMVDVISGMRPKNAADVLSVQDVEISVKILGSLPPTKVSKIFNSMDKEISARLQKQYLNMKR
jgi:flagellar motility protein MotE (MotC chaperone)